jgi:hypothetical protein
MTHSRQSCNRSGVLRIHTKAHRLLLLLLLLLHELQSGTRAQAQAQHPYSRHQKKIGSTSHRRITRRGPSQQRQIGLACDLMEAVTMFEVGVRMMGW